MAGYPANMAAHAEPRAKRDVALQVARLALLKIEAGNRYPMEVAKAALADIEELLR